MSVLRRGIRAYRGLTTKPVQCTKTARDARKPLHPFPNGPPNMVIWRLTDGKPGHDAQSSGLVNALAARVRVQEVTIATPGTLRCLTDITLNRVAHDAATAPPDLIIGAGHATHLPMLAARRRHGGRCVVLMKPSLPMRFFDLCIVPRHDAAGERENLLNSVGPLNPFSASADPQSDRGLMLIGGPSAHFHWSTDALMSQLEAVAEQNASIHWHVTDSRRTVADTRAALAALSLANVDFIPHSTTPADWVALQLADCAVVWVSADSVSMIYEALTTGSAVGVFDVPEKRASRVTLGLQQLRSEGWVTVFDDWRRTGGMQSPQKVLAEAGRCAGLIIARWFQD